MSVFDLELSDADLYIPHIQTVSIVPVDLNLTCDPSMYHLVIFSCHNSETDCEPSLSVCLIYF